LKVTTEMDSIKWRASISLIPSFFWRRGSRSIWSWVSSFGNRKL